MATLREVGRALLAGENQSGLERVLCVCSLVAYVGLYLGL